MMPPPKVRLAKLYSAPENCGQVRVQVLPDLAALQPAAVACALVDESL